MDLLADFRAHRIALTADMIAREIGALDLAGDATAKLRRLIGGLRNDAQALRDELAPTLPAQHAPNRGNVIYMRRF